MRLVVLLLCITALLAAPDGACPADGTLGAHVPEHCKGSGESGPQAVEVAQVAAGKGGAQHPKICIYAIGLNEIKHVQNFMTHCKGADLVSVADTGSTDGTPEALEALGAAVHRVAIKPFRFDTARNIALSLLQSDCDLCIAIDLDDQLQPGWLEALQAAWAGSEKRPTAVQFRYVWRFKEDRVTPSGEFLATKIHSRFNWTWRHPAHEGLYWTGRDGEGLTVSLPNLVVHHRPDEKECRGACRANYVNLLKLGIDEDFADPRRSYYYGRELFFAGQHEEAIVELERYLALPKATWREERAAALRHIAECHQALGRLAEAQRAALRGVVEWTTTREPWMVVARVSHLLQDWPTCHWAATKTLAITQPSLSFGTDAASWGAEPHDLAALSSYYLGYYEAAYKQGEEALKLSPADARLQKNMEYYTAKFHPQAKKKLWG